MAYSFPHASFLVILDWPNVERLMGTCLAWLQADFRVVHYRYHFPGLSVYSRSTKGRRHGGQMATQKYHGTHWIRRQQGERERGVLWAHKMGRSGMIYGPCTYHCTYYVYTQRGGSSTSMEITSLTSRATVCLALKSLPRSRVADWRVSDNGEGGQPPVCWSIYPGNSKQQEQTR